jgi:hypothetical protein
LRESCEYVRHRLTGRSSRVDRAIQGDERPTLVLRLSHHRCEIEHRAGEAVELGDDQTVGTFPLKLVESCTDARTLQVLSAEPCVLNDLYDLPAAPLALALDRESLCLKAGTTVSLFFATHADVG